MKFIDLFTSIIHYLIHPFKSHENFLHPEIESTPGFLRLTAYESLILSWVFVIINGILRIILLNFVILFLVDLVASSSVDFSSFIDLKKMPSYNFVVLSSILDLIFYPLFGLFIIQFWEFIFKMYGNLAGVKGDLHQKSQDILAIYFSSSILKIIPILGGAIQSIAKFILMYAGLRKQLHVSPALSVCIILTPYVILLGIISFFTMLFVLLT